MLAAIRSRDSLRRFGDLFALTGFVFAQPLLDVLGKGADVFVFRQANRGDIVQLLLLVVFGPSLVLWLAESLVALVKPAAVKAVHVLFVGVLFGMLAVQVAKRAIAQPLVVVAVAVVLGLGFIVLYARAASVRLWMRYAVAAPVAFALLFAFGTPVRSQLLPQSSARAGTVSGESSLVMVVLDEFPLASLMEANGSIDARLYPNFAALAKTATFYRNATTNAWYTPFAVPAIVSGQQPAGQRLPIASEYPNTVFTMFGPEYHRNVHELLQLCPSRVCGAQTRALGPGGLRPLLGDSAKALGGILSPRRDESDETQQFVEDDGGDDPHDAADDAAAERLKNPRSFGIDPATLKANQPTRFNDFLASLDGKHAKSLNFLHILMPHSPWRFTPNGARYDAPSPTPGLENGQWVTGETRPIDLARQRHLLQVRYLDGLIGQLVQRLKASGMWESSTVVITSDHGISFRPGSRRRGATEHNYHEIAWVPLFVKTPGQRSARPSDENAQSIDILPTVADAMGVRVPFKVDGRSLLGGDNRRLDEPRTFYTAPDKTMTINGLEGFRRLKESTLTHFARGSDPDLRMHQVGELGSLVGRRVADLPTGAPMGSTATFEERERFANVDLRAAVPIFGYGTLSDPALRGRQVAIAVNGTIGAVGPAFGFRDDVVFGGILPEKLFRDGSNDVTAYVVEAGAGTTPTLRALEVA